jgi:hypothetical protein
MAPMGLPCSNDIEMILQAFIEERTQWFYANPELIQNNERYISKAIKNPIIIYEKKEKIRIINVEKGKDEIETITTYHEYRQYENEFNEIRDENNNKITDEKYMEKYIVNHNKT